MRLHPEIQPVTALKTGAASLLRTVGTTASSSSGPIGFSIESRAGGSWFSASSTAAQASRTCFVGHSLEPLRSWVKWSDSASRLYRLTLNAILPFVIRSFRSPAAERLFHDLDVPRFRGIERAARRKLLILSRAVPLQDLRVPPGNRLEELKGRHKGRHSIRINDQWRICFRWSDGDAFEVEITDYH